VKFTEEKFDQVQLGNEERTKKYIEIYSKINQHMLGNPVTEYEFLNNYQLFRNLYHAMSDEHGNPGYMIVIYPKDHPTLETQFNEFYQQLKDVHQFKYLDRIKKTYIERMNDSDSYWNKYIIRKDKIIEFETFDTDDMKEDTEIDVVYESKSDLEIINQKLESKDHLNILYHWSKITIVDLWKSLNEYFGHEYQLIHKSNKKQRNFHSVKTITAYYKMTYLYETSNTDKHSK
jgi:hypothetical protein